MRLSRTLPKNRKAYSGVCCSGGRRGQLGTSAQKLRGRFRVPVVYFAFGQLVFLLAGLLCCFLFGCHGLPILPSIIHGSCNGLQLQLIECIESLKCEVKKKMMHGDMLGGGTKVTEEVECGSSVTPSIF